MSNDVWTVPKLWPDSTVFVIGGGPFMPRQFNVPAEIIQRVRSGSASPAEYSPYLKDLHGRHCVGVNNAYMLGEWLDVLFFGDWHLNVRKQKESSGSWYPSHREALREWPGIKASCGRVARYLGKAEGVKFLEKSNKAYGISDNPGMVSWNDNSGGAAINLAYHLGAKRIVLLGFDMRPDRENTHWHERHANKGPKFIPSFNTDLKCFPEIKKDADRFGIEIINCGPESAIDVFPKKHVREVLSC